MSKPVAMIGSVRGLKRWAKSAALLQVATTSLKPHVVGKAINELGFSHRVEIPNKGSDIEGLCIVCILCR